MRLFRFTLLLLVVALAACSDDPAPMEPPLPEDPSPPNNSVDQPVSLELTWASGGDADAPFDVYLGKTENPPRVAEDVTTGSYDPPLLLHSTHYYWRVVGVASGGRSESPLWEFTTEDTLIHPAIGYMYNWGGTGTSGFGDMDQLPIDTQMFYPEDIAFAPDGSPVIVDWNNHRVIGIDAATGKFKLLAGSLDGTDGEPCGFYPALCEDIGATETLLNHPTHVLFAPDGGMIMSAWHNSSVMRVDLGSDIMTRIAGTGRPCYDGDNKPAPTACIYLPAASVYDLQGRLWFTDQANYVVRMIDENGDIQTVAGTQPVWNGTRYLVQPGYSGDEGPATSAKFRFDLTTTCGKMCIDAVGNIYIADTRNHAVRMIDTSGIIHRVAGLFPASAGFSGDGGLATSAQLRDPRDVVCDSDGNLFIADTGNHIIRMVNPAGIISTVAGIPGVIGDSMTDSKRATESGLNLPYGIAIDADGNLWIADSQNSRIRIVYR